MRHAVTVQTPVPLVERRRRLTSREVSESAAELFLARGVTATTVSDIAQRAGVSTRTFHRYFPSKVEALGPVLDDGLQQYLDGVRGLPSSSALSSLLRGLAEALMATLTGPTAGRNPELVALVVTTPELLSVWLRLHEECARAMTPLLARHLPGASDPTVDRFLSAAVVTANRLAVEQWATAGGDVRAHLDDCLALLRWPQRLA